MKLLTALVMMAAVSSTPPDKPTGPVTGPVGQKSSPVGPFRVPLQMAYDPMVMVNRNDALYCLNPYMMEEARRLIRMMTPHLLKEVGCGVVPAQTKVRWIGEIGTELYQVVGEKEADDDHPVWVRADDFRNELEWAQWDVCSLVDVSCLQEVASRFVRKD